MEKPWSCFELRMTPFQDWHFVCIVTDVTGWMCQCNAGELFPKVQYCFLHVTKTNRDIALYDFYVQVNSSKWMPCILMHYCRIGKHIYF